MERKLYKNKYRIKSARKQDYDYSQDGWYFVTMCTWNKELFFGDVCDGEMVLNDVGRLAEKFWLEIPGHFGNIKLDEFVVMPNHLHGIIVIDNDMCSDGQCGVNLRGVVETPHWGVSTCPVSNSIIQNKSHKPEWKPKTLGVIINQFKGICTKRIHKNLNPNFTWQSRFHDRIIRNQKSLNNIRNYIKNNPQKWYTDINYVLKISN